MAALTALLWACSREPSKGTDAGIVVAEVDGVPIVLRDVKNEVLSLRGYAPSLDTHGPVRSEVSEAIRLLVERAIVLKEGERRGVALSPSDLEAEVNRFRADFPPGGLEKALLQAGMDMETWKGQLRRSLLYRKSAEAIAASVVDATPDEVEEAFRKEGKTGARPERIRVRQYLYDSVERAAAARERLRDGGSPGGGGEASSEGIDLGVFSREELPPELPGELFDLPEGGVSGPVSREGAASLFQVTRKESAHAPTVRTEGARIRASIVSARREAAFRGWLTRAAAKSKVRVNAQLLGKLVEGNP